MYNPQILERALMELNCKYQFVLGISENDNEYAMKVIEEDRKRVEQYCGKPIKFDNNYSLTWGPYKYGVYGSLDAMTDVSELVDPGIRV